MNLEVWKDQARGHWREHLPSRYSALKKAGTLDQALQEAAEQTYAETSSLEEAGFSPDEAFQQVRENYLFPPGEATPDDTDPNYLSALRYVMSGQHLIDSEDETG